MTRRIASFFLAAEADSLGLFQLGIQSGDFSGWNASPLTLPQRGQGSANQDKRGKHNSKKFGHGSRGSFTSLA